VTAPNLLFVMTDHQRADSIGMVQAGVEVCPNLNRLASESAFFQRAYNTCPLCVPARTAMATGKYPTRTGVVYNDWQGETATDQTPIHQMLADAGYDVAHIGVDHIRVDPPLHERVEFAEWVGANEYQEYLQEQGVDAGAGPDWSEFKTRVDENVAGERETRPYSNTKTWTAPYDAEHFKDLYWCRRAADFLRQERERPFALFLYLWAPHPPLRVPEPYASMFDPEALVLPSNVGQRSEGEPPGRRQGAAAQIAEDVSMADWRRAWAAHLGLVNLADTGIGRVLDALDEQGLASDTVTLFTVDHGDHLGQHRMYQKMEMYEQAVRLPLMVRAPGGATCTFNTPVSHLDVLPTLLDLLGRPEPGDLDGISLAESVREGVKPADRTVFSQYSGNPALGDIRRAAITRRYKYIYDPDDLPELYDLKTDPLEMHNLAADLGHAEVQKRLHAELAAWHKEHGDWVDYQEQ
jgi:arylsulfatase A-like enzyme